MKIVLKKSLLLTVIDIKCIIIHLLKHNCNHSLDSSDTKML